MWPLLGFKFDMFGRAAYAYSLIVLFLLFLVCRRIIHSPFGLVAARHPRERVAHAGDRRGEPARTCARSTPSPR